MGYTHYWDHGPIDAETWAALMADARLAILMAGNAGIAIAGPLGTGNPIVTSDELSLNGSEALDEDYETFHLTPAGTGFDFCKTAHRPYDDVVGAILLRAYVVAKVDVRSDGDINGDDWAEARVLYAMAFDEAAPVMAE